MSADKHHPHILVLPEDDANRQIANGFRLDPGVAARRIQVERVAGGWTQVLAQFESEHIAGMRRWPARHMILLIDFDQREDRLPLVKASVPDDLAARVFVLGAWSEPENLKKQRLGSYEEIGRKMAADCRQETRTIWAHELLRHNASELERLSLVVRPMLFS